MQCINILCFLILDSTRRWRCNSLYTGKSSSYALSVDVVIAICFNSYRQSPLFEKIYRREINFPILLSVWCSSLDVLHFTERNRKVKYYF